MKHFKRSLCLLFFFTIPLFSQNQPLDTLLTTIESLNINNLNPIYYSRFKFKKENIQQQLSAREVQDKTSRKGERLIIKNSSIRNSLLLNEKNMRVKSVVFFNCEFLDAVTIDRLSFVESISFIGCQFNNRVILNDISTKYLSFVANRFKRDLVFNAKEQKNENTKFIFSLNSVDSLKVQAKNIFKTSSNWGEIKFKYILVLSNSVKYGLFSGVKCTDIFYIGGNVIKQLEVTGLNIEQFLFCQYNQIDSCRVANLSKNENSFLQFKANRIRSLTLRSNILKYCGIEQNVLNTILVYDLLCSLSFHLNNNLYQGRKEINFKSCRINNITFSHVVDSFRVIFLDTLNAEGDVVIPDDALEIPRLNPRTRLLLQRKFIKMPLGEQLYRVNLSGVEINERNWHVNFKEIRKVGEQYRLNPSDTSLTQRHEIYTSIHNAYARQGKWNQADECYYEYKQFERKNYAWIVNEAAIFKIPKIFFHYLNWISCGYGIKPLRIFPFAFLAVLIFAIFYFLTPQPISNLEEHLVSGDKLKKKLGKLSREQLADIFKPYDFNFKKHKQDLIDDIISSIGVEELSGILQLKSRSRYSFSYFWNCFYFSFSTFTTVGLGDWYPSGNLNRTIVMIEGALGWLCLGLFITTYANVLLR